MNKIIKLVLYFFLFIGFFSNKSFLAIKSSEYINYCFDNSYWNSPLLGKSILEKMITLIKVIKVEFGTYIFIKSKIDKNLLASYASNEQRNLFDHFYFFVTMFHIDVPIFNMCNSSLLNKVNPREISEIIFADLAKNNIPHLRFFWLNIGFAFPYSVAKKDIMGRDVSVNLRKAINYFGVSLATCIGVSQESIMSCYGKSSLSDFFNQDQSIDTNNRSFSLEMMRVNNYSQSKKFSYTTEDTILLKVQSFTNRYITFLSYLNSEKINLFYITPMLSIKNFPIRRKFFAIVASLNFMPLKGYFFVSIAPVLHAKYKRQLGAQDEEILRVANQELKKQVKLDQIIPK